MVGLLTWGMEYKGMPDLRRIISAKTYLAVCVINGSDWAENANWLYVEWCTGEKELYHTQVDLYQVYNQIDSIYIINTCYI